MKRQPFGRTGLDMPPIIFGTSCLGNLYEALPWETKLAILREFFKHVPAPVALDSAGKYGAGLALEVIGQGCRELGIPAENLVLSNKLAWVQTPLIGTEPTFEPGAWADLKNDAVQRISHDGILQCWEQGCRLVGAPYQPQLASVHDPDEYLIAAKTPAERQQRWDDVLGAYRALMQLKKQGKVKAVGVGSKDWKTIREIAAVVDLDWVMLACSLTIYTHPPELLTFIADLRQRGIGIVNSAVFNAGFLTGGAFFDYRKLDANKAEDKPVFVWREKLFALCKQFEVKPAVACVQFGLTPPGISSIALNTSKPDRVQQNVALVQTAVPAKFWTACKDAGLIAHDYPYAG